MVTKCIFISHSAKESETADFLELLSTQLKEEYLFSWDEIPGNDDKRLIEFLKDELKIEWAKTEDISKIDDGKTIIVSNKEKSLSLKLNDEKTKANLKIENGRAYEFTVKTENGKLNIHEESFNVLVDRERLNLGDNWKYEIYNWMGSCHAALILLSKNAIENSMWVVREVNNLLWRSTLDSNFVLIPIYFGVTPEDIKKNKLFDDLDLEKYHGITDRNPEDLIQVIKTKLVEKLQQNLITTPLDEVAYQIATKLEGLSRERNRRIEIINNTLDKLNIEIEPWLPNRDPCLVLATKMLNMGLYESVKILDCFCDHLDSKDVKQIFDLLAPSWVDLRAANSVSECALHKEHKTVVVLNSSDYFSADMYVRRASKRPPKSWLIHQILGKYGVEPADEIVTEIKTLLIKELVSDEYDRSESEKRQALERALIMRNKRKKPVFIVLNYTKYIAKLLPDLQSALPLVTFLLLTGESFPAHKELEGLRFKFLEPPLEPRAENQAIEELDGAYGMIV